MWTCFTFTEDSHNTRNFMPYSFRIMCGCFNVPQNYCEHSRVVRRGLRFIVVIREDLKVLTICRCTVITKAALPPSYFKTLSVGPARVKRTTSRRANRCSTNWATGPRFQGVSIKQNNLQGWGLTQHHYYFALLSAHLKFAEFHNHSLY